MKNGSTIVNFLKIIAIPILGMGIIIGSIYIISNVIKVVNTATFDTLDKYGFTMKHPKYETIEIKNLQFQSMPPTNNSGVLIGTTFNHTVILKWFIGSSMDMDERGILTSLIWDAETNGGRLQDFKIDTIMANNKTQYDIKYFMVDGHKAHNILWQGKNENGEDIIGMSMIWYCKKSNRLFQIDITAKGYSPSIPMGQYAESFFCHEEQ